MKDRFLKDFNNIVFGMLYVSNIDALEAVDTFKIDYLGLDTIFKTLGLFSTNDTYLFETGKGK